MDKLFLYFLLPFLMCEAGKQDNRCEIENLPDETRSDKNTKEKAVTGCDNLPAKQDEDDFDKFPLGYLSDMYFVQADVEAENDSPADAFHKRNMAHVVVKNHEEDFLDAEQAIVHLLTMKGVDRKCMKTALQDYCDHLCDFIDSHEGRV